MFTDDDFIEYFSEIEGLLKDAIVVYTDLLNELNDNAMKSKIEPLAYETLEDYRFIKQKKQKFT